MAANTRDSANLSGSTCLNYKAASSEYGPVLSCWHLVGTWDGLNTWLHKMATSQLSVNCVKQQTVIQRVLPGWKPKHSADLIGFCSPLTDVSSFISWILRKFTDSLKLLNQREATCDYKSGVSPRLSPCYLEWNLGKTQEIPTLNRQLEWNVKFWHSWLWGKCDFI